VTNAHFTLTAGHVSWQMVKSIARITARRRAQRSMSFFPTPRDVDRQDEFHRSILARRAILFEREDHYWEMGVQARFILGIGGVVCSFFLIF
jgi:hypothetical protein